MIFINSVLEQSRLLSNGLVHTLNILLFISPGYMENDHNPLDQIMCLHCKKYINAPNYQIHEARCALLPSRARLQNNSEPPKPANNSKIGRIRQNGSNVKSSAVERKKIFRENSNEEQQRIPCSYCGYKQTLAQLDTHPATCSNRQIRCQYCNQMFSQGLMEQHQRRFCDAKRQLYSQQNHIHEEEEEPEFIQQDDQEEEHRHHSFSSIGNFSQFFGNSRDQGRVIVRESDGRGGYIIRQFFSNGRNQQPGFSNLRRGFSFDRQNERNASAFHQFQQFFRMIEQMAGHNEEQQGLTKQEMKKIERIRYKPQSNVKKEEKDLCTICYCQFQLNEKIARLKCKHIYHEECIFKWLEKNAKCPVCKTPQTDRPIHHQQ